MRSNWKAIALLLAIVAALAASGVALVRSYRPAPIKLIAATAPASMPATRVSATTQLADYPALLQYAYASLATTQPSAVSLPLNESAHVLMNEPVFCDSAGELWITSPLAPPTAQVLSEAKAHRTHVVREVVLFVQRAQDETGYWQPQLIVRSSAGQTEWITPFIRRPIGGGRSFEWQRASTWNGGIVVPSAGGISALTFGPTSTEDYFSFGGDAATGRVQFIFDYRGVLAWEACDTDHPVGHGGVRLIEHDQWRKFSDWPMSQPDWPLNIVQLIPLLDRGVLAIAIDPEQNCQITTRNFDVMNVDDSRVKALIDQLSDPTAATRTAAYAELQRWGAGAWPMLERAQADQPPEAQVRIGQLLAARDHPSLLGFDLLPGSLRVLARDGPALMLRADAGVSYQREGDPNPIVIKPACLMIDEHGAQLAPPALVSAIEAGGSVSHVDGEWLVTSANDGPRWWLANHFSEPLLRRGERDYSQLIDIDARGRWLFRRPQTATPTLIIDPTLPDTRPRLPVWSYELKQGSTGWTVDNWPAMKSGGAWALVNNDWTTVPHDADYRTQEINAATQPATRSSVPLLTDRRGRQYFSGADGLKIVSRDGSTVDWPLPASAQGVHPPMYLIAAGRIFQCGDAGRVARICVDGESPTIDATFAHNLPGDSIRRAWVDPAGRLDFAFGDAGLAVCFPDGKIPKAFADKMTAESLRQAEEDEPTTGPGD